MPRSVSVPAYRLHKQSGQAIVTLPDGSGVRRDRLLGVHGSTESRQEYARVIAEWEANGRRVVEPVSAADISINELLVLFWDHAQAYYRHADGTPTCEVDNIRLALRRLRRLYGGTSAAAFSSVALESVREAMIREGLARTRINRDMSRLKGLFKWSARKSLVPIAVYQSVATVEGLRAGRSAAKETDPVRPVEDALVEITLPHLTPPVRVMVQLQRCTGMRPGEVTIMRGIDLDMSGPVWTYRPGSNQGAHGRHKNAHRGKKRTIPIGPRGQELLRPWLRLNLTEYLFQPKDGRAAHDAARRALRKSKITPSQKARKPKKNPKRAPRDHYRTSAYAHAVEVACVKAHVAAHADCQRRKSEKMADWQARVKRCPELPASCWHPHQLRHTFGSEVRKRYDVETARTTLGHARVNATELYAERDLDAAQRVVREIG